MLNSNEDASVNQSRIYVIVEIDAHDPLYVSDKMTPTWRAKHEHAARANALGLHSTVDRPPQVS